jgi:hypothetical protein
MSFSLAFTRFILFATATALAFDTRAFDTLPEMRSALDDRPFIETWSRIDSEYASHLLNYSFSPEADRDFIIEDKVLQTALGSLSAKEFLIEHRLKLARRLTNDFDFRFYHFEEKNFDENAENVIWQFGYNTLNKNRIDVFGRASLVKEYQDIGFGYEFFDASNVRHRISMLFSDWSKNKRGESGEIWLQKPVTLSFTGEDVQGENWSMYYLRLDIKSRLLESNSIDILERKKLTLGFRQRLAREALKSYDLKFHYENREENNNKGERFLLLLSRHFNELKRPVELGFFGSYRDYIGPNQGRIYDILPFIWYKALNNQKDSTMHRTRLGLDVNFHDLDETGEFFRSPEGLQIESRFKVRHDIQFSKAGVFSVNLTFDIDEFGSSRSWEGGAGELRLEF